MDAPIRFEPFLRSMVWGGRRLEELLGKRLPSADTYGESWEVSDHPLHRSAAVSGSTTGRTLRDLMEREREAILGPAAAAHSQFPWLVKFLDCWDWLSVQVHPDEQTVRRLWPGEGSKTEAWFVIDVGPESMIYAGLLPGTDEARLRESLRTGTAADCLHRFKPRPGDCVFLRAGTVHAVGGGVLMAEVQQTSDATFRLFDWNRKDAQGKSRQLHIEEGLASIDWSRGPVEPVRAAGFTEAPDKIEPYQRQSLVRCPFFEMDYVQAREPFDVGGVGRLQTLVVVRGQGQWLGSHGEEDIAVGQTYVLPSSMPRTTCRPQGVLGALLCTLP